MALSTSDWQHMRRRYERGETYGKLAGEYGVSVSAICRRSRAEGWGRRGSAGGESMTGQCLAELTQQMLCAARETLRQGEGCVSVKEMRDLTALVRELLALQRMAREEQDADREDCVRVVLDRQVEDWSV